MNKDVCQVKKPVRAHSRKEDPWKSGSGDQPRAREPWSGPTDIHREEIQRK